MGGTKKLINFLIKLQNAVKCKKFSFIEEKPTIKIIQILDLLINAGYIRSYLWVETSKKIKIILKYQVNGQPLFNKIKIISKPSTVTHLTNKVIKQQISDFNGVYVFSTSQGFLTQYEVKKRNLGGILFCKLSI